MIHRERQAQRAEKKFKRRNHAACHGRRQNQRRSILGTQKMKLWKPREAGYEQHSLILELLQSVGTKT